MVIQRLGFHSTICFLASALRITGTEKGFPSLRRLKRFPLPALKNSMLGTPIPCCSRSSTWLWLSVESKQDPFAAKL